MWEHFFWGLVRVVETADEVMLEAVKTILEKNNIEIKNCIRFSGDGANNVTGSNIIHGQD